MIIKFVISSKMLDVRTRSFRSLPLGKSFFSKLYFLRDSLWILIAAVPVILVAAIKRLLIREKNLNGKVILITGSGNGLGKELALQLAKYDANVACVDIAKKDNKDTVESVRGILQKGKARDYFCDVSNPDQTRILAQKVIDDFGHVDILINNAGIVYSNKIDEGSEEMIEKVIRVNLLSNFWMVRAFLPSMKLRNKGHIVFINSASAIHGFAHGSAYTASKFGLLGFTHALEEELRSNPFTSNIKLSSVHPYFICTNNEFLQFWNLRLQSLDVKQCAAAIISGIRKELYTYAIPGSDIGYPFLTLLRLLPKQLYHLIRDTFYCEVRVSDEGEVSLSDVARLSKKEQ